MQLLTYTDESGIEENPTYCVIAGFIASPETWRKFDDAWEATLKGEGDIQEFKSSQFFGRKSATGSESNPYLNWDDEKALDYVETLAGIIREHNMSPVRGAVNMADFRTFGLTQRRVLIPTRLECVV